MDTKYKIIAAVVLLLGAFAFGRFSAPEKVKIQTVEVEKKTEDKQAASHDDKVTTITQVQKPDGTKTTTTVIADVKDVHVDDKKTDDVTKTETKEIDRSSAKVTVSALMGVNITNPGVPMYGISISKPILGPITVGVFGFQNGLVGASVGLTF
jgi:hypothetical protein